MQPNMASTHQAFKSYKDSLATSNATPTQRTMTTFASKPLKATKLDSVPEAKSDTVSTEYGFTGQVNKVKAKLKVKEKPVAITTKKPVEISARQKGLLFAKTIKRPKLMRKSPAYPKQKHFDAELNTIEDVDEDQETVTPAPPEEERCIIEPNHMKLVEQTIKMLNMA